EVAALRDHFCTVTPPVVTLHRPAVWPDAITMPAEPVDSLRQLRQGAYDVIQAVLGQERMHEPPETIAHYRPHVSVAYINTQARHCQSSTPSSEQGQGPSLRPLTAHRS